MNGEIKYPEEEEATRTIKAMEQYAKSAQCRVTGTIGRIIERVVRQRRFMKAEDIDFMRKPQRYSTMYR